MPIYNIFNAYKKNSFYIFFFGPALLETLTRIRAISLLYFKIREINVNFLNEKCNNKMNGIYRTECVFDID